MAIVIPSKNIYNKNNPKVRDNVIDNVTVDEKCVRPKDEYEVSIYNEFVTENLETITDQDLQFVDSKYNYYPTPYDTPKYRIRAVCGYNLEQKIQKGFDVLIPKVQNNSYIPSLNSSNIKIGLRINQTYSNDGTIIFRTPDNTIESPRYSLTQSQILEKLNDYSFYADNLNIDRLNFSHDIKMQSQVSLDTIGTGVNLKNYISATWTGDSTILNLEKTYDTRTTPIARVSNAVVDGIEYYKVSLSNFLVSLNAEFYDGIIGNESLNESGAYEINLVKIKQELQEITIRIDGDKKGLSVEDAPITIESGTKPFSVEGNELLQDSGTVGEKSIAQHLGDNVINQYKKGKETANILCNISDYYAYGAEKSIYSKGKSLVPIYVTNDVSCSYTSTNDYSTLVVTTDKIFEAPIKVVVSHRITGTTKSTTIIIPSGSQRATKRVEITYGINSYNATLNANMVFEQNDKVIPMVLGADGNDHPMSVYQNGEPKIFTVVGTDIIFDGAVWQQLTLQEYNN